MVRPSRAARSIAASIASRRSGPMRGRRPAIVDDEEKRAEPVKLCRSGLSTGRASARMIKAASSMRKAVSHHGLCAGVSSVVLRSLRSRVGGNTTSCGLGGVSRNSHQMAGKRGKSRQHPRLKEADRADGHHGCRPAVLVAARDRPRRAIAIIALEPGKAAMDRQAPPPRAGGRCDGRGTTSRAGASSRQDRCDGA